MTIVQESRIAKSKLLGSCSAPKKLEQINATAVGRLCDQVRKHRLRETAVSFDASRISAENRYMQNSPSRAIRRREFLKASAKAAASISALAGIALPHVHA